MTYLFLIANLFFLFVTSCAHRRLPPNSKSTSGAPLANRELANLSSLYVTRCSTQGPNPTIIDRDQYGRFLLRQLDGTYTGHNGQGTIIVQPSWDSRGRENLNPSIEGIRKFIDTDSNFKTTNNRPNSHPKIAIDLKFSAQLNPDAPDFLFPIAEVRSHMSGWRPLFCVHNALRFVDIHDSYLSCLKSELETALHLKTAISGLYRLEGNGSADPNHHLGFLAQMTSDQTRFTGRLFCSYKTVTNETKGFDLEEVDCDGKGSKREGMQYVGATGMIFSVGALNAITPEQAQQCSEEGMRDGGSVQTQGRCLARLAGESNLVLVHAPVPLPSISLNPRFDLSGRDYNINSFSYLKPVTLILPGNNGVQKFDLRRGYGTDESIEVSFSNENMKRCIEDKLNDFDRLYQGP